MAAIITRSSRSTAPTAGMRWRACTCHFTSRWAFTRRSSREVARLLRRAPLSATPRGHPCREPQERDHGPAGAGFDAGRGRAARHGARAMAAREVAGQLAARRDVDHDALRGELIDARVDV